MTQTEETRFRVLQAELDAALAVRVGQDAMLVAAQASILRYESTIADLRDQVAVLEATVDRQRRHIDELSR